MSDQWRCFHCDKLFTTSESASEHFGKSEFQSPACQLDIAEYRRIEEVNRRYCEEDTDLHRALHAAESKRHIDVQRAEEAGYAKGLNAAPGYIAALERELSEAKELLREIRDSEVNPEDEADKFLRDHVCSELSKLKEREARLRAHIQEAADIHKDDESIGCDVNLHYWHLAALE